MEPDYRKIGFKCGIEIHQQIDTAKLFCPCPSVIRDEAPDMVVDRMMRAVAGETGDIDPAALHEFLRGRSLHYEAYKDTNCLVELDEEPPHPLNREALRVALEVSLLLRARPVQEIHVMRKTVIDGSNTSGFQRTMLIAVGGAIETSEGTVGIPTICLEEDAARIIGEDGGDVRYRLDRLGIPLIELATAPDIKNPRHAREVAEKIGGILRASGVKRGLGTIRQDLNVSIAEGQRIEVKGVQDLRLISKAVEGEVERQLMLVEVRKELAKRGVIKGDYRIAPVEITGLFKATQSTVVRGGLEASGVVLGARLRGLKGLLKGKLGPQLAQYARALAGVKGIFHGDELPAYGISPSEVESVMGALNVSGDDSYVLLCGGRGQASKALAAVLGRCEAALEGVPDEVRRAKEDGSTEYMRPLPGSSRMYPETDEPFVKVDAALLGELSGSLPELREDKAKRYQEFGLSLELATQLSRSPDAPLFERLAVEFRGLPATVIAQTLTATPKEAQKRYDADLSKLGEKRIVEILRLLADGRISRNVVAELMAKLCESPDADAESVAVKSHLTTLTDQELKVLIDRVVSSNPGLDVGKLTGKVMAETKGRAEPRTVQAMINSLR
jgi:glutamyl-tRNA(Gln) amidotransferase subunit E